MKNKNFIINIIIFVLIVILVCLYVQYNVNYRDDVFRSFFIDYIIKSKPDKSITFIINKVDQGRYISSIFQAFICSSLPLLFHIHPNDSIFLILSKGLNTAVICYMISCLSVLKKEENTNNIINPIIYLWVSFIVFIILANNLVDIINNTMHFVYFFNYILALAGIILIGKYYINNKLPESKDLVKNSILACFVGFGGCIINIPIFCSMLFITCFSLIKKRIKINYILNKNILIPFICFFITSIFTYLNYDFISYFKQRIISENLQVNVLFKNIIDFIVPYLKNVFIFHLHLPLIIVFSTLIISIFIINKRNNNYFNKHLIFALSIIFSICFFDFLMVLLGKNTYYTENTFWITHIEIQTVTSLYILSAIVICLDYLKEYKNTYKILFCTIFILILSLYSFKGQLIYGYNNQKKIRTNMYICEKAYLYQYKNKLNPVVFPELEETDDWQHIRFVYMYKTIYNNESYNAKEYKSVLVPPEDFYEKMDKLGLDFKEIQTDKKLKFGDITKTLL